MFNVVWFQSVVFKEFFRFPGAKMENKCGIIHDFCSAPKDEHGCLLPSNHKGPHEYSSFGRIYQWETDMDCDCEHCVLAGGDYCTLYWEKKD